MEHPNGLETSSNASHRTGTHTCHEPGAHQQLHLNRPHADVKGLWQMSAFPRRHRRRACWYLRRSGPTPCPRQESASLWVPCGMSGGFPAIHEAMTWTIATGPCAICEY
jgi:hypothetical protein